MVDVIRKYPQSDQMRSIQHRSTQVLSMAAIAASLLVGGCRSEPLNTNTSQPQSDTTPLSPTVQPYKLGLFTADELFAAGSGGCGMSLLPVPEEIVNVDGAGDILLFHGIDSPMLMKINGELQEFELEDSVGEEFYGQKTKQTFSNADLGLTVEVEVSLGELGEIESVNIPEGKVSITAEPVQSNSESDQVTQQTDASEVSRAIAVNGDAGC